MGICLFIISGHMPKKFLGGARCQDLTELDPGDWVPEQAEEEDFVHQVPDLDTATREVDSTVWVEAAFPGAEAEEEPGEEAEAGGDAGLYRR